MICVLEHFVTNDECTNLVAQVNDYRREHEVPLVERPDKELPLKYEVIDGDRITECLPRVLGVYDSVTRLVKSSVAEISSRSPIARSRAISTSLSPVVLIVITTIETR